MNKIVLFALFAALPVVSGISFSDLAFPTQARIVARNTTTGSVGLIAAAIVGEMVVKSIRALPTPTPTTKSTRVSLQERFRLFLLATKTVGKDVFCSSKHWKLLGTDLRALIKPSESACRGLPDEHNRWNIFYRKHRALCWATGVAAVYTCAAWARYGVHLHTLTAQKAKQEEADRLAAAKKQRLHQLNTIFSGTTKAVIAIKKNLKNIRKKKEGPHKPKTPVPPAAPKRSTGKLKAQTDEMRKRLAEIEEKRKAAKPTDCKKPQEAPKPTKTPAVQPMTDQQKNRALQTYLETYWDHHDPLWRTRGKPIVAAPAPGSHTCSAKCRPDHATDRRTIEQTSKKTRLYPYEESENDDSDKSDFF